MLPLTSPLGDEGHPLPQRGQRFAGLTQTDEAERRSSSSDRMGIRKQHSYPSFGGWRKNKGESWVPHGNS